MKNKLDSAAERLRKELVSREIDVFCVGSGNNCIFVYLKRGKLNLPHFEGYEVVIRKIGRIRPC